MGGVVRGSREHREAQGAQGFPSVLRRIVWLYAVAARAIRSKAACATCGTRCCRDPYCAQAVEHAREAWGVALPAGVRHRSPGGADPPPRFLGRNGRCIIAAHLRPMCALFTCAIRADPLWWRRYGALRRALARAEAAAGLPSSAGRIPTLAGHFPPAYAEEWSRMVDQAMQRAEEETAVRNGG